MENFATATGHISIIQEERFRLITDDGRSLLLTLAHGASIGIFELDELKRNRTRLRVGFTGEPNQANAVAHFFRKT